MKSELNFQIYYSIRLKKTRIILKHVKKVQMLWSYNKRLLAVHMVAGKMWDIMEKMLRKLRKCLKSDIQVITPTGD